jgi:hypothetical protein
LKEGGGGSRKINIKERKKGEGRKDQALKEAVGICTISNFWNTWNRQGGRLIIAVYGFGGRLMELGIQWCALSITDSVLFSSIVHHLSFFILHRLRFSTPTTPSYNHNHNLFMIISKNGIKTGGKMRWDEKILVWTYVTLCYVCYVIYCIKTTLTY